MAAPDTQARAAQQAAPRVNEGGVGEGGNGSRSHAPRVSSGGAQAETRGAEGGTGGADSGGAQVSSGGIGEGGGAQADTHGADTHGSDTTGAKDVVDATKRSGTGAGAAPGRSDQHTIALYVNDRPGVLVRVALVFARRGFNIESLVVSPSALGGFSRMTITCSGAPEVLEQIIKALNRLVDVVHATDHTDDASYETEIALVKIAGKVNQRTEILQIAEHYEAKVVDYGSKSLILRVAGGSDKIDAFIELLRPFGIVELVRSGKLLMARGLMET